MNTEESNGVFGLTTQGIGLLVTASKQSLDEQPMLPEAQYFYLIYPNTVGDSLVARKIVTSEDYFPPPKIRADSSDAEVKECIEKVCILFCN